MMDITEKSAIRVVAIGDSVTYGFPYTPADSWLALLADELAVECINKGVCGDTTEGMLERFARHVLSCRPTHTIIMGGTNDVFEYAGIAEIAGHIRDMVQLARDNGVEPVIGLPIPCRLRDIEEELAKLREELERYAAAEKIKVVDFSQALAEMGLAGGLLTDGIHPSREGYRQMAAAAVRFFQLHII